MNLVLLGTPGSGKGTQAIFLKERFKLFHLSTGDLLRTAIAEGSSLGLAVREYLNLGQLVPDDLMIEIFEESLTKQNMDSGFVLDGFPRTLPQAEALEKMLSSQGRSLDAVLNLQISAEVAMRRLGGRRLCSGCQAVYHLNSSAPAKAGICDYCGQKLVQREDDRPHSVLRRLELYARHIAPVIDFYNQRSLLRTVSGDGEPERVSAAICAALEEFCLAQHKN